MSNPYYRFLDLPFPFFDQEAVVEKYSNTPGFDPSKNKQWRIEGNNPDIFNKDAYSWLDKFGCYAGVAELFYTAPNSGIRWHVDISGYSPIFDYVKINFIWGPDRDHYMEWAEPKPELPTPEIGYNSAGSPHMIFKEDQVNLVESVTIDRPILVNVGRAHRAVNKSDQARWCLCLIPKIGINRIAMPDAIELFKDFIS